MRERRPAPKCRKRYDRRPFGRGVTRLIDRAKGMHPDAERYLVKAAPWLDRAPLVILGLGVAWILVVALLWIAATALIVAFELDAMLHMLVAAGGILLILAYVIVAVVAWILAKRLKTELAAVPQA